MNNRLRVNTKDESLANVFSNGKKYFVPRFQRDYSWKDESWRDLWEDITAIVEDPEEYHYMGYLVLQPLQDPGHFRVIDGQQRLTTFSLMALAAIKRLREIDGNSTRADEIFKSLIGSRDIVDLKTENKLVLNRNDDYYYRKAVNGQEMPKRKKKSVSLMRNAHDYFYDRFKAYSREVEISRIIKLIAPRMLFTIIEIGDELNAYKVFETLNARGVKLSSSDLLKNHLFSLIDPSSDTPDEVLDRLDEKWKRIGEEIGKEDYASYIRAQWNSDHTLTRKSELFRSIKKEISGKEKANDFLDALEENSELYGALLNGSSEFWKDHDKHDSIRKDLDFMKLFGIRQHHSLMMAAYRAFKKDFHKVTRWIKTFSFRYNVICGEHTGEQEIFYGKISNGISRGWTLQQVKEELVDRLPSDDKFKQDFAEKTMPQNKRAKYVLARLEEQETGNKTVDEADLTIEHLLPENPNESWIEAFGESWSSFVSRLGNLALTDPSTNKKLGQKPFEEKKRVLLKLPFKVNKSLEIASEWGTEEVESRQKKMAATAAKIWKIS